ncbi:MAG: (2Fe-2S) ferredoxin domain-containing protein [bacterium]|nr:(2Fe-2S) ferredoxin domain-containing protein [bacterium]
MYFEKHVFVCENLRQGGRECCAEKKSVELRGVLKRRAKEVLREAGLKRRIRINGAACLDRCEEGPVAVVYPEGHWFRLRDADEIERFATSYLKDGDLSAVEDLRLSDLHPTERPRG